jgi:hypothetical protein
VVPINLLGDTSCAAARELFDSQEWHVESVVRFYRRDVLFTGVLQRVCVFTARKTRQGAETVGIRGGRTVEEARASMTQIPYANLTRASPDELNGRWKRAWLCVPEEIHYEVWEHLRRRVVIDVERLARGRIVFQQGDVNKTRTKIYRSEKASAHTLPLTCGALVKDFGPWHADVHLDPKIDAETCGLSGTKLRDALRERIERIERVQDLDHDEAVLCLKDNVGMEPIRPIRGALYTRGPDHRFLFDHTLQIGYAVTAEDNDLVRAVFGLLTSAVSNYILQLFSTNAHVTTNELLRTPVPELSPSDLHELAEAAEAVQASGEALHRELELACGVLRLAKISFDAPASFRSSGLAATSLDVLIRRRQVTKPEHESWTVSRLLESGELQAERDPQLGEAMATLLADLDRRFDEARHEDLLPDPAAVPELLSLTAGRKQACEAAYEELLAARAAADRRVFQAYGIENESWQRAVVWGAPWAVEGREETERLERALFR